MIQKLFGLLVLLVVAGCLYLTAMEQGLSWYTAEQNDSYVKTAVKRGWVDSEDAWHKHYRSLERGLDLQIKNAEIYWQLGEMHRLLAAGLRLWPGKQRQELRKAREYYVRAAALRPADCQLLSGVSQRLAYKDDSEAIPLMRRCLEIASYEPVVQYQLADVGMRLWDKLDPSLKRSFTRMLVKAIRHSRIGGTLKTLARKDGREEMISSLLQDYH